MLRSATVAQVGGKNCEESRSHKSSFYRATYGRYLWRIQLKDQTGEQTDGQPYELRGQGNKMKKTFEFYSIDIRCYGSNTTRRPPR
jgi:hypothetical protein